MARFGPAAVPAILALTLLLAPAAGATGEAPLQDTLKSAIVALGALLAAFAFVQSRPARLQWHPALLLPLLLLAYALGSMLWSHAWLAGVEAIRWFVFAVLMALGLNTVTRERLPLLAVGIVAGSTVASLWAVLQFLLDVSPFPQGPPPASTFVNRNFFAEFAVCALPLGAVLLARAQRNRAVALASAAVGLQVLALFMTGTRSALVALALLALGVFPLLAWRFRAGLALTRWSGATRAMGAAIVLGIVIGLGSLPTANRELRAEERGTTALQRAFERAGSIAPGDASLALRMKMWRATGRMIAAHPWAGVGAGAWENVLPLYQADADPVETDFYAHNEFLQLIAEDGAVGWLFLLGLLAWLARACWRTWRAQDAQEGAWRGGLLASLLALLVVSNAGFPWRMAASGALFAICVGALAASDLRIAPGLRAFRSFESSRAFYAVARPAIAASALVAAVISSLAFKCEADLVGAARTALAVSASGHPDDPRWASAKAQLLARLHEGVAINPHYRKLTPVVADELARWGDWPDAIWAWESVLESRPYVVAMLTNVARGYVATGRPMQAQPFIERAGRVQPDAPSVRSAEVLFFAATGQDATALDKGRAAMREGLVDFDLANAVFVLGRRQHDFAIAEQAMTLRLQRWDRDRAQGWLELAQLYSDDLHDPARAAQARARAAQISASKG